MGQHLDKAAKGAYDAIVYIDGSEVVAEDSNGRKIASGAAGTDLTTVWNSLIAGIQEHSTIILDGLGETISTPLYANVDGLKIRGINGARITTAGSSSAVWIGATDLWKTAIDLLPTTNLTADIGPSDVIEFVDGGVHKYWYTAIPVADPSIVDVGDWILLASNTIWTYTERTYPNEGELFRVMSVGASDIVVVGAAHDTYSVSDGAKIIRVPMIQDVELSDMHFIGTDVANGYGVVSNFVHNMKMSNIRADLFAYAAIAVFNNVSSIFDSIYFDGGFQSGAGYGLEIANSCQDLNISNIHGNEKRHVITVGAAAVYGIPRRINVVGCSATNGYENAAFDAHHCSEFVQYDNLTIDNYPMAIKASGVGSNWSNIKATNISGHGVATGGLQGASDLLWPSNIYRNFNDIEIHFGTTGKAFYSELRCHQMNMHNVIFDGITNSSTLFDPYKFQAVDCIFVSVPSFTNYPLTLHSVNNAISDVVFTRCRFLGTHGASDPSVLIQSSALRTHDVDFTDCYLGNVGSLSGVHFYNGNSSVADILVRDCIGPNPIVTRTGSWTYTIRDGSIGRYLTRNFGSSTGTGSEQTIAHGLAVIPTGCKAWIRYPISATVYAEKEIRMDATNIYPKVKTGLVYDWRVE